MSVWATTIFEAGCRRRKDRVLSLATVIRRLTTDSLAIGAAAWALLAASALNASVEASAPIRGRIMGDTLDMGGTSGAGLRRKALRRGGRGRGRDGGRRGGRRGGGGAGRGRGPGAGRPGGG